MTDLSEHRLYHYLSESVQVLGLTLDEWGVVLVSVAGGLMCRSAVSQLGAYGAGGLLLYGLKKFKKHGGGQDLKAYLYWQGFWPAPSATFPSFAYRVWLS